MDHVTNYIFTVEDKFADVVEVLERPGEEAKRIYTEIQL